MKPTPLEKQYDELSDASRRRMQREAIDSLEKRGMPIKEIADYVGVWRTQLWAWRRPASDPSSRVGRKENWVKLIHLSTLDRLPREKKGHGAAGGRVAAKNLGQQIEVMRENGLWPPGTRARTMNSLRKRGGFSWTEFAKEIDVGVTTAQKLSDSQNRDAMTASTLESILKLKREMDRNKSTLPNVRERQMRERYEEAMRKMLGWAADGGFARRSDLKVRAIELLAERMGRDSRSIRRYLEEPPKRKNLLLLLEEAAEKGLLLPELAPRYAPKEAPPRKKAKARGAGR